MFPYEMDFKVIEQQRQSKMQRAEKERLIKALAEPIPSRQSLLHGLAYWLGKQMVLWGARLQTLSPMSASEAAGYRLNPSPHTVEKTTLDHKYRN
ncbi:MAG: hypothetical protein KDJ52_14955 [Anaerolineae bacterium]|nr:hypothetical protein [Anaerolineae bacterium]